MTSTIKNEYWEKRKQPEKGDREDEYRSEYSIDYGRIVHSASFRRLQGKTQILNLGDSDFYRTRMTHSLEVSQIATGILSFLQDKVKKGVKFFLEHDSQKICLLEDSDGDANLIRNISLLHDLGHPPFGHGGETALNYCMYNHGGFEGNGQTLRIISKLGKYTENDGANLTRRVLLGILKYPVSYKTAYNEDVFTQYDKEILSKQSLNPEKPEELKQHRQNIKQLEQRRQNIKPPKCYLDTEQDVVDWILKDLSNSDKSLFTTLESNKDNKPKTKDKNGQPIHKKPQYKSFDCSIMDTADDIAYGVHDLEDAVALGLVRQEDFIDKSLCKDFIEDIRNNEMDCKKFTYDDFTDGLFSDSGRDRKQQISRLVGYFIHKVEVIADNEFRHPLLKYNVGIKCESAKELLKDLKDLITKNVIKSANVKQLEFKGMNMVIKVFDAFSNAPDTLLPNDERELHKNAINDADKARVICDYIAGMTDGFLLKTYERLFSPRMGTIFDRL